MEETATDNAGGRFTGREHFGPQFTPLMGTMSPSQRLKDLFFATYTNGASPSATQKKASNIDFSGPASWQVPSKKPATAHDRTDNSMDVDAKPPAQDQGMAEVHISEEDLQGPVVPLAINSTGRFYSEHMRRCELRIELLGLSTLGHCPRGMYVMPSLTSINVWHGVMFVKRGYWKDGVIRFRVDIPREYPNQHPVISLTTPVFHPLVRREDGRFALEQQFPKWTPYSDYIFHALYYFKNAFKNRVLQQLGPRDCYNIDAYMKFKGDLPRFREFARIDAMNSHKPENLYQMPQKDCPIVFSPMSDEAYQRAKTGINSFAAVSSKE